MQGSSHMWTEASATLALVVQRQTPSLSTLLTSQLKAQSLQFFIEKTPLILDF